MKVRIVTKKGWFYPQYKKGWFKWKNFQTLKFIDNTTIPTWEDIRFDSLEGAEANLKVVAEREKKKREDETEVVVKEGFDI